MENLNKKELFLIEEYKSAIELTFQIDTLRNKLTSFFISISGIGTAGLLLFLKSDSEQSEVINLSEYVAVLLLLVALIGHLFICVLAKIRRVQLEHFGIINNIRKHFYGKDYTYWNIAQLSSKTLPKPKFLSGTYFWLLIIQVLNITVLFIGLSLIKNSTLSMFSCEGLKTLIITALISLVIQNSTYFYFAKPPSENFYSENNSPV